MKKLTLLALVTAFALALPAAADPRLTAQDLDAMQIIPPPPEPGSPRATAELDELHAIAAKTDPAALERATRDANDQTGAFYASVLGPAFDLTRLPKTAKLLADVGASDDAVAKPAKDFFHRDRPYIVDPKLKTCTPVKPGPAATSYPSGHSTVGYSMGIVLAAVLPAKAQAILTRARQYAENRLVCGMHFRADIVAGEALGTAIALKLEQSPEFAAQMNAARAELAAVGI
ncbi:MAG TPA: phosphatase PAP2 family protein [Rhizomicrobium sp.]|jgi:acid phosphatase (class A)|nr:phosphatase PAP2 family protein [Rhizomicrobium sp.]